MTRIEEIIARLAIEPKTVLSASLRADLEHLIKVDALHRTTLSAHRQTIDHMEENHTRRVMVMSDQNTELKTVLKMYATANYSENTPGIAITEGGFEDLFDDGKFARDVLVKYGDVV